MSWRLDPAKSAVLIVDVQERLVAAIDRPERLLKHLSMLLDLAEVFSIPVLVTEQAPGKLGPTAAALGLSRRGITPVSKTTFSAAPVLPATLPPTVVVAGVETHGCVRQTTYDLRLGGRTVVLAGDALSSRDPEDHLLALEEMRRDQVLVTSVAALGWELTGAADAPAFKRVLAILK